MLTPPEQQRLQLAVQAARVGIIDWESDTLRVYYSPRFCEIRGFPPQTDTSSWPGSFGDTIHPEDRETMTALWTAFLEGSGPEGPKSEYFEPAECRLLRVDGSFTWVEISGVVERDEKGFVARWTAAVIDINDRRTQRDSLRESRDRFAAQNETLKENVRLREEVERISRHDLKTPLNSILAVPRLLREERQVGPRADELLRIVERAGYRILSMVNRSLDLYKMEQGIYDFRPDAVDLAELALKVFDEIRLDASTKKVKLVLRTQDPPYAWAEELLCYSIFANLLKNAVEASPDGGNVEVTITGREDSVELRINNAGAVPFAIREKFFSKYATLGKSGGNGLGCYSAWLMARMQEGRVEMQTSEAEGTTLVVSLRAAPADKAPAVVRHTLGEAIMNSAAIAGLPATRVLVVDDDEYNLHIMRRFLTSPPCIVSTATNGRLALDAAALQWPDLVLMDLDMPIMGGMQATKELREFQRAASRGACKVVALSSHDDEDTIRAALAGGFDKYLTKPVAREAIHALLLELHNVPGQQRPADAPGTKQPAVPQPTDPIRVDADFEPIIGEFLDSRRALLVQVEGAAYADDRGELRTIAHRLAGSFALYGFVWASERSRWLERNFTEPTAYDVSRWAAEVRRHLDTADIRFDEVQT